MANRWCGVLIAAFTLQACGGGGAAGVDAAGDTVGTVRDRPTGGLYFVDPHQGGSATSLGLADITWGRLVDIFDLDEEGNASGAALFRDIVVRQQIISDGTNYVLSTNPLTQRTRLIIQRQHGADPIGGDSFDSLLRSVTTGLPPILPKHDDGSSAPPFSLLPRNAALVCRFNDVLEDSDGTAIDLPQLVRIVTGYRPNAPFSARLFFDENHGAVVSGEFHSTRIVVDMATSEQEAQESPYSIPVNAPGLPASELNNSAANVSLRIPSEVDFSSGQFKILTNLSGATLNAQDNRPTDFGSATRPLVRALRSGNSTDINRGFLFDLHRPKLLGVFPGRVEAAQPDEGGREGFDFILDLVFESSCQVKPRVGDVIDVGDHFLEVTGASPAPDFDGRVNGMHTTLQAQNPLELAVILNGSANLVTPYFISQELDPACWARLDPTPGLPPSNDASTHVGVTLRFSEAMRPVSLGAFETVRIVNNSLSPSDPIPAEDIVVSRLIPSVDLEEVRLAPLLPLANDQGLAFFIEVVGGHQGVTDLAGNPLELAPRRMHFRLDPDEPPTANGGFPLRFGSFDEVSPAGAPDVRGQVFLDTDQGILRPRPVSFGSVPVDRGNPLPSIMSAFASGLQSPLSALGSKVMSVWRYCDLGWRIGDETRYDIDVTGMSWSPIGGSVVADFFDRFEMRVSHADQMPDEFGTAAIGPFHPLSGLLPNPFRYTDNVLAGSVQQVVHPRHLGYRVDPSDIYANSNGTALIPFPWNTGGGPLVTFTWRDTSILTVGGDHGLGVPLERETKPPTTIEETPGSFALPGQVPTVGLPLLWEIRTFPSSNGLGLNPLDVSVALHRYCRPVFRVFSTGGFNGSGDPVFIDPDNENIPMGGFNPNSMPPGRRTPAEDPVFYVGQLDIVVRISRAHTMWFDTGQLSPTYADAVIEPDPGTQPPGTSVLLEYRGASNFNAPGPLDPFNAALLDAYGDLRTGEIFYSPVNVWVEDLRDVSGARFFQVRFSFFNNIETGQSPTLSAAGFAFSR